MYHIKRSRWFLANFCSDTRPFCVLISLAFTFASPWQRPRFKFISRSAATSGLKKGDAHVVVLDVFNGRFALHKRVELQYRISFSVHRSVDFSEKREPERSQVKFAARWTVLRDHRFSCPPLERTSIFYTSRGPARMLGVSFEHDIVRWKCFQRRGGREALVWWSCTAPLETRVGFQIPINHTSIFLTSPINRLNFSNLLNIVEMVKNPAHAYLIILLAPWRPILLALSRDRLIIHS